MKRAILVGVGTVAGVAAVLGYHPGALFGTAAAAPIAEAASATDVATSSATSATPSATTSTASAVATSQTITGDAVQTRYGVVQVEVTVSGSTISDVTAIASPDQDRESAQISAFAIPVLEQQAVAAQSASIDGVSGASYTSQGFAQSLQSALAKAGLA